MKKTKILILVDGVTPRHSIVAQFMSENLKNASNVTLGRMSDISFEIAKDRVVCKLLNTNIEKYDLVYFRAVANYLRLASSVAYLLSEKKKTFIDASFNDIGASGNKLNALVKLGLAGIPVVPTTYVSRSRLLELAPSVAKKYGYPLFAKNLSSQRREGIFIIENLSDFEKLLKADTAGGFILQKRIHIKEEYRAVVMGKKVTALHKESPRVVSDNRIEVDKTESHNGWKNNEKVSQELQKLAIKATKTVNLNISGVDICIEKRTNKLYVFEVNRGPGMTLDANISPELQGLVSYVEELVS
jgi:glutathione synthase/RimK-type ligase-like ATP-grasp enzyme